MNIDKQVTVVTSAPNCLPWSKEGLTPSEEPGQTIQPATAENKGAKVRKIPPLAIFSPNHTEQILQDYFARGGSLAAPSNFGSMCERAFRTSHIGSTCQKCGGSGCSQVPPEEMVERTRRVERNAAEAKRKLKDEHNPVELEKLHTKLNDARKALTDELLASAACKRCSGTGVTPPRKIPRGHGDTRLTTVQCPKCAGCGTVGAPDEWQIRRLVTELGKNPQRHLFHELVIVHVALTCVESIGDMANRWGRVLDLMQNMALDTPQDVVVLSDMRMPNFERDLLRALRTVMRDDCKRCDGNGYVLPITVRETGSSISRGPEGISSLIVARHGEVDRIFSRMRNAHPQEARALEAYYGPTGNRWGHTDQGRAFALWPLTRPGEILARESMDRSEKETGLAIDKHEALFQELAADRRSGAAVNPRRRSMLDQADKASRNLLDRMRRAWTAAALALGVGPDEQLRSASYEAETAAMLQQAIDDSLLDSIQTGAADLSDKTEAKLSSSDYPRTGRGMKVMAQ